MAAGTPWWRPDLYAERRPFLLTRAAMLRALRDFFATQGFVEVETSILQTSPGNEAHLHGFETRLEAPDGTASPLFLHTSPEFACKKLLTAGEPRIASFSHVFRNRERGPLHHPEFTLLEWYRTHEPYEAVMEDCLAILKVAAEAARSSSFTFRGRSANPLAAPERLTVAQAFDRFVGIDLLATVAGPEPDRDALAAAAAASAIRVAGDDTWSDIFSRVMIERIEPNLGLGRATILAEYPMPEAALARPAPYDARVAERFELYVCGVEIANGFGELTDAGEQRRRLESEMAEKRRVYGKSYPIDEDFLAALAVMPAASGVALGFDRLVMLATGAARIEQVLWTPVPEPGM